jgi:hypothetical protein
MAILDAISNYFGGPWKKNSHKNEDPVPVFFFQFCDVVTLVMIHKEI